MTLKKIMMTAALLSCVLCMDANAITVAKITNGDDDKPDIELVAGVLSTASDGRDATMGDQNTEVNFLGHLSSVDNIVTPHASFTLDKMNLDGPATKVADVTVMQKTSGGEFFLWDDDNALLLSGTLGNGVLHGPLGATATGGLLSAEFGTFTGGSLLSMIGNASSSTLSISLTDVNGGLGLSLDGDNRVANFVADATAQIGATTPEPTAFGLMALGTLALISLCRSRR